MAKFLSQIAAQKFDEALMSTHGFTIDQLMELAGLAVAQSVAKEYSPCRTLVVCGPGNNGGDGLVAARHLKLFGFVPEVVYSKPTDRAPFVGLLTQCRVMDIPIFSDLPELNGYELLIDAIFGFSFRGEIRSPFDTVIHAMRQASQPIVSVDIPSGWNVETGNGGEGLQPSMLVSLTLPKLCAEAFEGVHYVGGRFVPPKLAEEFEIEIPEYPGCE